MKAQRISGFFVSLIIATISCFFVGDADSQSHKEHDVKIQMKINGQRYDIALYDNPAAKAFAAQLPMTLEMMELNGNEKYAELPDRLPTSATRPGTIHNGDLMLYGSQTLVLFYATFKSSYAYTPVGRIDSPQTLAETAGTQSARIEFFK